VACETATKTGFVMVLGENANMSGEAASRASLELPGDQQELLERVGRVTAEERAPTGIHETFSPVLCLTRDIRWGRTGETFGEDLYLIGELGAALIRGYQGRGLADPTAVVATAKHYAGYSETQGGRDASEADISRRKLCSYFLPPLDPTRVRSIAVIGPNADDDLQQLGDWSLGASQYPPEACKFGHRVFDHFLLPQILKTFGESRDNAGSLFSLTQKKTTGIRGNVPPVDLAHYFSPP